MKFIQTLSESRMLNSTAAYKRYSARQIAELVYLHVISLRILAAENLSAHFAEDYAKRSVRYLGFAKWYQNGTDLHLLLHALVDEDVELKMPDASQEFKETLYFDEAEVRRWLKTMMVGRTSEPLTRSLFLHLDGQFQIKDGSAKAIRRLVQDWPRLTKDRKQLAMTRLLQIMRVRGRYSDLLPQLEQVAKNLKLELHNVSNQETGDVPSEHGHGEPKKKSSLIGKVAAGVAGAVMGYYGVKSLSEEEEALSEDDGGGATTSANAAPVVAPLGAVQRRVKKKKKK